MPYCPVCGYEYEEGVKVCSDCDAELVDELSEDNFEGELAEVFSSFSVAEAGMVKELLHNEGIFAAASNEMGSALLGGTPSSMGEVKVFVSGEHEERAREIIESYLEENPLETEDEYLVCGNCGAKIEDGQEVCPYCGRELE